MPVMYSVPNRILQLDLS